MPFGKYWLDAELAQGGMSRVFDARLRGPGGFEKRLVVKQILPQLAQDPSFVELFVQEANTLVQMSHPNVVPVYELGVLDGVYFLAMERVHGATVAELLEAGALPQALAALLGAQICEALRYAHERFGLVHRDVTPRNVMVDGDGHVRLLDFGIAAPSAQTGHGELFGSPGYMSPEQAARKPLAAASDMFALGAVLYEALSGRRASERAPDAPELAVSDGIDAELSLLIARLLAHEPGARPSASDSALALRTWLARNHPQGVQHELGARAEQASRRKPRADAKPGDSVRPGSASSASAANGTPRVTRSIATSQTLVELLGERTEALPGRVSAAGQDAAAEGAERAATSEKRGRGAIGIAIALVVVAVGTAVGVGMMGEPNVVGVRRGVEEAGVQARSGTGTGTGTLEEEERKKKEGTGTKSTGVVAAAGRRAVVAASSVAAAGGSEATAASAAVSVNALPWATVHLDGRALGSTPQRALAVRAGSHVLQLDCPPLGRSARVPLKLAPGDHPRVVVDMQTDPPTVSVR